MVFFTHEDFEKSFIEITKSYFYSMIGYILEQENTLSIEIAITTIICISIIFLDLEIYTSQKISVFMAIKSRIAWVHKFSIIGCFHFIIIQGTG